MAGHRRLLLVAVVVLLAATFVGFGILSTQTWPGVRIDYGLWSGILTGLPPTLREPLDRFARDLAPIALTAVAGALFLVALARQRWRRLLAGLLVAVLPALLTMPIHLQDASGPVGGSYPSNHATAALGVLAAVVILWPAPVGRTGLAVTSLLAYLICLGNVSWYAHAPRDVVGSALAVAGVLVALVALLGTDVLNLLGRRATAEVAGPDCDTDLRVQR